MERKAYFYSDPRLKLAGILEIPSDHREGEKRPCVILCQGPGGVKEQGLPEISKWLAERGYVVFRFDYRGFGESEGVQHRLIPLEQVEDIRNAITFIQQKAEVDSSRIGLWGVGCLGGANASYTAGIDTRVKCMVSVGGMSNGRRWMQAIRRYWEWVEWLRLIEEDRVSRVLTGKSRLVEQKEIIVHDPETAEYGAKLEESKVLPTKRLLSVESAEAILNYKPETVVDGISPGAAMWLCAENDTIVPIDHSRNMYLKAHEPKKLVILEGEVHHGLFFEAASFERMMTHSTEWFDSHL